ncbi:MAG: recombinase RecA [Porphyromonas sp.]|nr:recombinase RecA [Porphyromonas sp.]
MAKEYDEEELDLDQERDEDEFAPGDESASDSKKTKKTAAKDEPKKLSTSEEKLKALKSVMSKLEKTYGKGSIMNMGDDDVIEPVDVIPTGSMLLDLALGVGGYPRGRIVEIYGPEGSGKTTLAIHAMAECQKTGGLAAIIDAENAFDRFYAENLGVDLTKLWISQPDNGEQALMIAEDLIRSSAMDLVVIDSVAALTPKGEIDGDMGENKIGLQARLMSQALRKLAAVINKTNTTCIFINQLREKIGGYGTAETTTGGNALKYYASVRLDIRKGERIMDSAGTQVGNMIRAKVVKNKVAPPFKKAEFEILYGKGIQRNGEILDAAEEMDIVRKSGSWFSYGDTRLGQGREKAKVALEENPDLLAEIEKKVVEGLKNRTK